MKMLKYLALAIGLVFGVCLSTTINAAIESFDTEAEAEIFCSQSHISCTGIMMVTESPGVVEFWVRYTTSTYPAPVSPSPGRDPIDP